MKDPNVILTLYLYVLLEFILVIRVISNTLVNI